jgi:hypothetical protein
MDNPSPSPQPEQQDPHQSKKRVNIWMIIAIVLLLSLASLGAYVLGKNQATQQVSTVPQQTTTPNPTTSGQAPTALPSIMTSPTSDTSGTVTGKLCYPSSLIPKGTITAKNASTSELTTQDYPGSQNGGGSSYSLSLKPGTYHLKYTPQDYPTVIGFYTDYSSCVGSPTGPNCSGQKTRPVLPVVIISGKSVTDVNLCDFYYPPDSPPQF